MTFTGTPGIDDRDAVGALRRAHDALVTRAGELTEANERLSAFASTVSHDLMQPVAALAGFLSLLDRGLVDLDAEHRTWLDAAIRGKDRLAEVIESLHRHAVCDDLLLGPVDLQGLVDELVPGLLPADARLEVDALPIVPGDPGLITQVLANLAQNAVRYRQRRPMVVRIRATGEPSSWLVTVTDNGRGIAADELETVFASGHRGSAARGTEGTGRGLATVRSLMVRMGGEAWAEAPDEAGARICLRFARPC